MNSHILGCFRLTSIFRVMNLKTNKHLKLVYFSIFTEYFSSLEIFIDFMPLIKLEGKKRRNSTQIKQYGKDEIFLKKNTNDEKVTYNTYIFSIV